MRYKFSESPTILGQFVTGDTVTISVYDLSDSSVVTLTANSCAEVASTGIFKWNTSDIATQPTTLIEYLWVMGNGSSDQHGKIMLGGYVENIDGKISEIEIDTSELEREVLIVAKNTQPICAMVRGDDILRTEDGAAISDDNDSEIIVI